MKLLNLFLLGMLVTLSPAQAQTVTQSADINAPAGSGSVVLTFAQTGTVRTISVTPSLSGATYNLTVKNSNNAIIASPTNVFGSYFGYIDAPLQGTTCTVQVSAASQGTYHVVVSLLPAPAAGITLPAGDLGGTNASPTVVRTQPGAVNFSTITTALAGKLSTPLTSLEVAFTSASFSNDIGLTLSRNGGPTSAGSRGVCQVFKDANNETFTSGLCGVRTSPDGNFNGDLALYTNSGVLAASTIDGMTQAMVIKNSGTVGIGTPSPVSKLDVYGPSQLGYIVSARFNGSNFPIGLAAANSNGYPYLGFNTKQTATDDTQTYDTTGSAYMLVGPGYGSSGAALTFRTAPTGAATGAITWTDTLSLLEGNVGIGTSTPLGKLHVREIAGDEFFTVSNTDGIILVNNVATKGIGMAASQNSTYAGDGSVGIKLNEGNGVVDAGTVSFLDEGAVGMTYKGAKLGIGTATPATTLDVNGAATLTGVLSVGGEITAGSDVRLNTGNSLFLDSGGTAFLRDSTAHQTLLFQGGSGVSALSAVGNLELYANTGLDASGSFHPWIITSGGDVLIENDGSQAPVDNRKLRVNMDNGVASGEHITALFSKGGLGGDGSVIAIGYRSDGADVTAGLLGGSPDSLGYPIIIRTAATPNAIYVSNTGEVGISTANPQATLDVAGNALVQGDVRASTYLIGESTAAYIDVTNDNYFLAGCGNPGYTAPQANTNLCAGGRSLAALTEGSDNVTFGNDAGGSIADGTANTIVGSNAGPGFSGGIGNTFIGRTAGGSYSETDTTDGYNTFIGYLTANGITTGKENTIIGAQVLGLAPTLSNNVIIADGAGNIRMQVDGTGAVTLNGDLTAEYILANTDIEATGDGVVNGIFQVGSYSGLFGHVYIASTTIGGDPNDFNLFVNAPPTKLNVIGDAQFGAGATKSTFTAAGVLLLGAVGNTTYSLETSSGISVGGSVAIAAGGTITVGGVSVISSTPTWSTLGGASFAALASGTTFQTMTSDSAVSLRKICMTVAAPSVAGAGDTVRCNTAAGVGIEVTSANAAAVGTTTCSSGVAAVAYQDPVFCHLESAAATKPLFNVSLGYVTP